MALPFSLSIGDVMLLSSLAWKIGRAFTSGRAGAPSEFREVENELSGLNTAIDLLAESIDADDSILASADDKTKDGLDKILGCCRQVSSQGRGRQPYVFKTDVLADAGEP